ncbi:MAG: helix-turn-helix transcriptional regulator [Cyclobacteriaceae bacterium]|nr:helix-turn-helix transcriptional regulator [Cyclobacteriaceae bacterium]
MAMLFFQVIYFLERTSDRKRLLYLILLVSVILYNITSGLFPDQNIPIPVMLQTILAYLFAFGTSMYFVYYYYKAFNLRRLKFFVTFGSLIFLFVPFLFLFVVPYYITGDLAQSRKLGVVIPFLYGIAFIGATTRAFIYKFREREYSDRIKFQLVISAYIALLCWVALPLIVFFGDFQVLEHSVTNSGFMVMTLVYIRSSIHQARREYDLLLDRVHSLEKLIEVNCGKYNLTSRETEIARLIMKGHPYKIVASDLGISEKTVARHVSNIFSKVSATNKVELINKLEQRDVQVH